MKGGITVEENKNTGKKVAKTILRIVLFPFRIVLKLVFGAVKRGLRS